MLSKLRAGSFQSFDLQTLKKRSSESVEHSHSAREPAFPEAFRRNRENPECPQTTGQKSLANYLPFSIRVGDKSGTGIVRRYMHPCRLKHP